MAESQNGHPNGHPKATGEDYQVPHRLAEQVRKEVDAQLVHSGPAIRGAEVAKRLDAARVDQVRGEHHLYHLSDRAVADYVAALSQGDEAAANRIFNAGYYANPNLRGRYFATVDEYEQARIMDNGDFDDVPAEWVLEVAKRRREAYHLPNSGWPVVDDETIRRRNVTFYDQERGRLASVGAGPDSTPDELAGFAEQALQTQSAIE